VILKYPTRHGRKTKYSDTIKKNTKVLVVTSKEIGLEVNAEKTVYGHVSRSE
jgi:hypothetical protein